MEGVDVSAFWRDRPTFVNGATGLIGGWLVRSLVQEGADVVCLVRDWVPQSALFDESLYGSVKVVRGDLLVLLHELGIVRRAGVVVEVILQALRLAVALQRALREHARVIPAA